MRRISLGIAILIVSLGPPVRAQDKPRTVPGTTAVDLMLVLAADVSRSITDDKYELQRKGYAAEMSDPDVPRAIASGPNHRIAVAFVEWAARRRRGS